MSFGSPSLRFDSPCLMSFWSWLRSLLSGFGFRHPFILENLTLLYQLIGLQRLSLKPSFCVQPSVFDMRAGENPASAMGDWAE